MAKIYKDFQDFVQQNESLLNHLGHDGQSNILRAIWQARQGEIEGLQKELAAMRAKEDSWQAEKSEIGRQTNNEFFQIRSENESLSCQIIDYQHDLRLLHTLHKHAEKAAQDWEGKCQQMEQERDQWRENFEQLKKNVELSESEILHLQKQLQEMEEKNSHLQFSLEPLEIYGEKMRHDLKAMEDEIGILRLEMQKEKQYSVEQKEYVDRFKENARVLKEMAQKAKAEKEEVLANMTALETTIGGLQEELKNYRQMLGEKEQEIHESIGLVKKVRGEQEISKGECKKINSQKHLLAQEILQLNQTLQNAIEEKKTWHVERDGLLSAIARLEKEKEIMHEEALRLQNNLKKIQNSIKLISQEVDPASPTKKEVNQ
jgi:chromosome segregation ATPase